jgi:hypothetical protein
MYTVTAAMHLISVVHCSHKKSLEMIQIYLMYTDQRSNTDLKFTPARQHQHKFLWALTQLGQTVIGHNAAKLILL